MLLTFLLKKKRKQKKTKQKSRLKVFEILKNFFQKVFKWGTGQRPE